MGLSRQEYCSGLPFPPPGGLPDPGLKPTSPALADDSLPLSHLGSPVNLVNREETNTFVVLNMGTMVFIESMHLITDI